MKPTRESGAVAGEQAEAPASQFHVSSVRPPPISVGSDSLPKKLDFTSSPKRFAVNDKEEEEEGESIRGRSFSPMSTTAHPPPTAFRFAHQLPPTTPLSSTTKSFRSLSPFSAFDDDKFFDRPGGGVLPSSPLRTPRVESSSPATALPTTSFLAMSLVDKNASSLSPYRESSKAQLMLPYHTSSKAYNDHFISYSVAGILKPEEPVDPSPKLPPNSAIKSSRRSFAQEEEELEQSRLLEEEGENSSSNIAPAPLPPTTTTTGIWSNARDAIWGGDDASFTSTEYSGPSKPATTNWSEISSHPSSSSSMRFGSKLANEAYANLVKQRDGKRQRQVDVGDFSSARGSSSSSRRSSTLRPASKLRYESRRRFELDSSFEEDDGAEEEEGEWLQREISSRRRHRRGSGAFGRRSTGSSVRSEEDDEGEDGYLAWVAARRRRRELDEDDDDLLSWSRRRRASSRHRRDSLDQHRYDDDEEDEDDLLAWRREMSSRHGGGDGNGGRDMEEDDDVRLRFQRRRGEEAEDDLLHYRLSKQKRAADAQQQQQPPLAFDLDRFRYAPKPRKADPVPSTSSDTLNFKRRGFDNGGDSQDDAAPLLSVSRKQNSPHHELATNETQDDAYILDIARNVMDRPMHTLETLMREMAQRQGD